MLKKELAIGKHQEVRCNLSKIGVISNSKFPSTFEQEIISVNQLLYRLNYFHAPIVREKADDHLILESVRNKVWNPVFTIGVIMFILSMTLRGFFDQHYAAIFLGISTFILFAGIWKLSSVALVIFDKNDSKIYFVYKHLGYLQKVYMYPLTSFDSVEVVALEKEIFRLQLQKDDGTTVKIAESNNKDLLLSTWKDVSEFLQIAAK